MGGDFKIYFNFFYDRIRMLFVIVQFKWSSYSLLSGLQDIRQLIIFSS